jgi:nitrate/nitrite-specific signal transduction histidine kinase
MGLQIMHHRARVLGGLIDIQRSKLGGMQVTAVVPSHAGDRGI